MPRPTCPKPKRIVARKVATGAQLPAMVINSPEVATVAVAELIGDRAYEVFLALYLGATNCVIGYDEFSSGALAEVAVDPSGIVRNALLVGALGVVTAHQHPSGSLRPSADDEQLWGRLELQLRTMQITSLDDLIVTEEGYYSRQEGRSYSWAEAGLEAPQRRSRR